MPRTLLALLFALLALVTFGGCATQPSPVAASVPRDVPPQLPATPLGRIASEWLAAVNSGSDDAVAAFVNARYSAAALRDQDAASRIRALRKLQAQSGGLDLVEVTPAAGQLPMSMLVKSRRGARYARVFMGLAAGDPERLAGSGIERSDPPAAELARLWPSSIVSDRQMIGAIRKEIDRRAAEGTFSGVVLVARGDEILLHEARGLADREAAIPNRLDTKFHLASVGKMFTAASIAQLVRDGRLSFDSKIIDVLPDYPNREVASKVTIGQLLAHSGGLGTFFGSPGFTPGRRYETAADQIAVFQDEPLFFEPGTRWRYSNAGYAVLGAIIERLSGERYVEHLRRRLFGPIGMKDTYTETAVETAPAVATLYEQADDDPLGLDPFVPNDGVRSGPPTGFGGGYSNALDMFRFLRAFRTGRLLGPELTRVVIEPRIDVDGRGSAFWAYGMRARTVNGVAVRDHRGGGRANVAMLWEPDYTIVVLANSTPPPANAFADEIAAFIARQRGGAEPA